MCSELVTVTAGRKRLVGNLEEIARDRCSVLLDCPIAQGTPVKLECVACPRKAKGLACLKCKFAGKVEAQEENPNLGIVAQISFEGRSWSKTKWRPGHLTDPSAIPVRGIEQ
jgi:hypothetical protein